MHIDPIRTWLALLLACGANGCKSVELAIADSPTPERRMDWWRESRFGLFIHWGLYAIPAGEWNGRTDYGEWIRANAEIPLERYDALRTQWNPTEFDASEWARIAHDAGVGYVVITTKHHDGFALFDSQATDWDVMSTPWKRDVMGELSRALAHEGLATCWYHSIMDWHHPDYLPRRAFEKDRASDDANYDRYESFLHAQVTELLTHYGPIGVMWFDGEWESTWNHARGQRLYDLCRRLQPNVIVNNRVDVGRSGMAGLTAAGEFCGDYGTPEQEVPATGLPGVDWESCLTMNDNWGYNAHDKHFKSVRELLRTLADVASKGGNLLLNVGPTATGEFPPECVERLQAIGRWMRVNGDAIHGTQASPIDVPSWGRITQRRVNRDARLYLHVFDWPADRRLVVEGLRNDVLGARLLADPRSALHVERSKGAIEITVPSRASDTDITVVELTLRGEPIVDGSPRLAENLRPLSGRALVQRD